MKLWNWESNWSCERIYEGHAHYVMQIALGLDTQSFASVSLDGTVREWDLKSNSSQLTINSSDKGVNAVCYMEKDGTMLLITAGDDRLVKVWDHDKGVLIKELQGHKDNVSDVLFVKEFGVILSASEDGSVKIWNVEDWTLVATLDYDMGKAWNICEEKGKIAIAYDKGFTIVKLN